MRPAAPSLREVLQGRSREAGEEGTSSKAAPGDAPSLKPHEAPRCTQEEVRGELSPGLAGQGPPPPAVLTTRSHGPGPAAAIREVSVPPLPRRLSH